MQTTKSTQNTTSAEKIDNSPEVISLQAENTALQAEILRLRVDEDRWNDINRKATIWGVALGGIVTLVFGLAVFVSSKKAASSSLNARPAFDRREQIEKRLRELRDTESEYQIKLAAKAASRADEKAEHERLERVNLEALIAPRRLTLDQQNAIGKACLGISGKPILVASYGLDTEAAVLANEIILLLSKSGFTVISQVSTLVGNGVPDIGLQVRGPAEEQSLVDCLGDALHTLGGLAVVKNGPRHRATTSLIPSGIMFSAPPSPGETDIIPAGPLPNGNPVTIVVGVKPAILDSSNDKTPIPNSKYAMASTVTQA